MECKVIFDSAACTLESIPVLEKLGPGKFHTYHDYGHTASKANFVTRHVHKSFNKNIGNAEGRDRFLWVDRLSEHSRVKIANYYRECNVFIVL